MNGDDKRWDIRALVADAVCDLANSDGGWLLIRQVISDLAQASSGGGSPLFQFAKVLHHPIAVPWPDVIWGDALRLSVVVTSGSLAMAPMGMNGNANSIVPLPADTIAANKSRHIDLNNPYAILLLAVIAWALYVVGPRLISELPPADQTEWSNYWSIVDPIAVSLTGYLISRRDKAR
jgi:hypothetical protein